MQNKIYQIRANTVWEVEKIEKKEKSIISEGINKKGDKIIIQNLDAGNSVQLMRLAVFGDKKKKINIYILIFGIFFLFIVLITLYIFVSGISKNNNEDIVIFEDIPQIETQNIEEIERQNIPEIETQISILSEEESTLKEVLNYEKIIFEKDLEIMRLINEKIILENKYNNIFDENIILKNNIENLSKNIIGEEEKKIIDIGKKIIDICKKSKSKECLELIF